VAVTYEAGPTGFGLYRHLIAATWRWRLAPSRRGDGTGAALLR
jgi:hypothetical protein